MNTIIPLLIASVMSGSSPVTPPVDSAKDSVNSHYRVAIGRSLISDTTTFDTLTVTLKSFQNELAAFDLKIATDQPTVEILQILPGTFYDSCHWEFFNAKTIPVEPKEGNPSAIWQAIGISETIPDDTAPSCYHLDGEVELVKVIVAIKHGNAAQTSPAPLFFYWEDCTDNTISSRSGDTLAISGTIFDYFDVHLPSTGELFPTRMGTPRQCVTPGLPNTPRRLIEFHNGGIEFRAITPDTTAADSGKAGR